MMFVVNILAALAIAGMLAAGVALFWIARQDGSPQGRFVGVLLVAAALVAGAWFVFWHG